MSHPETIVGAASLHISKGGSGLMADQTIVALGRTVGTHAMRPAVGARRDSACRTVGGSSSSNGRSSRCTIIARSAVAWVASVVAVGVVGEGGHHGLHLLEKSGFTLKETGLAISNDGIGGWECSWESNTRRMLVGGGGMSSISGIGSVEEALGN
jgi:hypothetical protein